MSSQKGPSREQVISSIARRCSELAVRFEKQSKLLREKLNDKRQSTEESEGPTWESEVTEIIRDLEEINEKLKTNVQQMQLLSSLLVLEPTTKKKGYNDEVKHLCNELHLLQLTNDQLTNRLSATFEKARNSWNQKQSDDSEWQLDEAPGTSREKLGKSY